jgi:hypothetical protein
VGRCTIGECGAIVVPLSTIDGLYAHQVGIGALPTTGYGSTMEIDQR